MAQLVEALRYKQEGRELDSRLSHWDYSLASNFPPKYGIEPLTQTSIRVLP